MIPTPPQTTWRALALAAGTATTLIGAPASAAPDSETAASREADSDAESPEAVDEARALRSEAEVAFGQQDYATAIERFEAAHARAPHPTDLFNLGRIYEEAGDLAHALEYYDAFASQPRLSLEQRAVAAERIEVLRKIVAQPEPTPAPATAPRVPVVTTAPAPPLADSASRDPGRPLIISGGVLAIAGGVGFGLVARRNAEDVNALSDGQNPERLSLREAEDLDVAGRNAEALQITFTATGGGLALLGGSLLVVGLVKRQRARRLAFTPSFSTTALGAHARWTF